MAGAAVREELICLICLEIYREPVTLACGHTFCQGCIGKTWDEQWEREKEHTCPECRHRIGRRPDLKRNPRLHNLVNLCLRLEKMATQSFICCLNCDSPTEALQSCLTCEISLCPTHLGLHQLRYPDHIMCEPLTDFGRWKCPIHKKILESYCTKDGAFICESCCLDRKHRGHRVELLSEASEKKKEKLGNILEKLSPEREETERGAQRLQERRREVEEKAAGETERVTALFRDIREQLEALEMRLLSDISSHKEKISLPLTNLIRELEIKKKKLGEKMRHIEELCNMGDQFSLLKKMESEGADIWEADCRDIGGQESDDEMLRDANDMDEVLIMDPIYRGLQDIVTGTKKGLGNESIIMDTNTASMNLTISTDGKSASYSRSNSIQVYSKKSQKFQVCAQVLSTGSFNKGRHYWDVDCSKSAEWRVGVAYPSIERGGNNSLIGNNSKSWAVAHKTFLSFFMDGYIVSAAHDGKKNSLSDPHGRSEPIKQIRVYLDYEAGRLSFYEMSETIRHLHTFSATFTEPLHAAFYVGEESLTVID